MKIQISLGIWKIIPARQQIIVISKECIKGSLLQLDKQSYDLSNTALIGRHNALNALFAIQLAHLMGLDPQEIRSALASFRPVEHRLERVASIHEVVFFNDSKATNVDAVFYALEAMDRPIVWIVGGQDKGNDYIPLVPLVRDKVKAIVCLGLDNSKIMEAFSDLGLPMVETQSAETAVAEAQKLSEAGDAILLSPACASFDLFKNYEDRGRKFKAAVHDLMK